MIIDCAHYRDGRRQEEGEFVTYGIGGLVLPLLLLFLWLRRRRPHLNAGAGAGSS